MSHSDETSPHRLFAAIVLMGTGLAVGCGGMAEGERPSGVSGGPSGSAPGGSSSVGGGGGGASAAVSSAGTPPILTLNNGGNAQIPDPITPGPFACPPQQWTCSQQSCGHVGNGWSLQEGCDCDPARPLTAGDCAADEVFLCLDATSTADGRPLTEHVLLSCTCAAKSMYFCSNECDVAYGRRDLACNGSEDQRSATCGCAFVYLK